MGSGTTFMEVSGGVMKNVEVYLPDLTVQKRVAEILSSIDDKIELNNRINHNLAA
jgi:type I restriction enzyme S subunit